MFAAGHILLQQKDQYSQLQLMVLSAEDSISGRDTVRTDSKPSWNAYFVKRDMNTKEIKTRRGAHLN